MLCIPPSLPTCCILHIRYTFATNPLLDVPTHTPLNKATPLLIRRSPLSSPPLARSSSRPPLLLLLYFALSLTLPDKPIFFPIPHSLSYLASSKRGRHQAYAYASSPKAKQASKRRYLTLSYPSPSFLSRPTARPPSFPPPLPAAAAATCDLRLSLLSLRLGVGV